MKPRVRFAPSPTGQMHVGNARTALFNWLYARHHGGAFILRIEDTDTERGQGGAEEAIYEDLAWLRLEWDEGPVPFPGTHGNHGSGVDTHLVREGMAGVESGAARSPLAASPRGPYRQSERGALYEKAYEDLRLKGAVYPCFCADTILEQERRTALEAGRTPGYSGRCSTIDPKAAASRIAASEPFALRFRAGGYGIVQDLLRGSIDFRARQAFDPVIRRRDGRPTYNFAVVVDDAAMEITHVLRGEDHLTNTALQMRLYDELQLSPPNFAHLPLILGSDGAPLSKRHGATSVGEFRRRGYPAEALVGSLALLGWTPPGEKVLMGRDEMVEAFDLGRVHATPAIFDFAKLDWISGQVIRTMNRSERAARFAESLREAGLLFPGEGLEQPVEVQAWLEDLADLLATSVERFDQVPERAGFLFAFDPVSAVAHGALEGEGAASALETFARLFESAGGASGIADVPDLIERAKTETGLKGRALLHPLRVAVTGSHSGPELVRVLPLIERGARLGLTHGAPGLAERIRQVLALPRTRERRA